MMLMRGVAGCTLDSAPAPVHGFAGGIAVAGQPDWDFNRAIVLYADQSPLVEP